MKWTSVCEVLIRRMGDKYARRIEGVCFALMVVSISSGGLALWGAWSVQFLASTQRLGLLDMSSWSWGERRIAALGWWCGMHAEGLANFMLFNVVFACILMFLHERCEVQR